MRIGVLCLSIGSLACLGQSATEAIRFEAASVRPADPGARMGNLVQGGPGTSDPTRFTGTNVMLSRILLDAFGIRNDQLNAPDWVGSTQLRFDIAATVPAGATKEQLGLMLQNLLADRFHLVFHRTQKEFPVYDLVIAKDGPKLTPSTDASRRATRVMASCNGNRLTATALPAANLASTISGQLGARVVDKTGLTGTYDVTLFFEPGEGNRRIMNCQPGADPAPSVEDAVQQQLGLRLEKGKGMFDVIVIDRIDKTPVEN